MPRQIPIGQILLSLPVIQLIAANYFVDVLGTHVCNPDWDGHARYHNAQTIDLMIWLEAMSFYYTWRSIYQIDAARKYDSLLVAALTGSAFMATGLIAPLFPGRLCLEQNVPAGEPGMSGNFVYGAPLVVIWLGYWLACRAAGKSKVDTKGVSERTPLTASTR